MRISDLDDRALVALVLEKNKGAENELVNRYANKIYSAARSVLRHSDRDTLDEAAQRTFIKVFKALPGFKFEGGLGSWVMGIAMNTARDMMKSLRVRSEKEAEAYRMRPKERSKAPPPPLEKRQIEAYEKALKSFPEKDQALWKMRIDGRLSRDIAHILNISEGYVRIRLLRMKEKLEEMLRKYRENRFMIATQNRSGMQAEIVRAFLAGRKKSLGTGEKMSGGYGTRYKTDGKTLWVWGNLVAERSRGAVYITDAGWLTMLTKNTLNEILEQLGINERLGSSRKGWVLWKWDTHTERKWTGSAIVKGGKVRLLHEGRRLGIVFGGYHRRLFPRHAPPPPPPPRKFLFNTKARGYTIEIAGRDMVRIRGRGQHMRAVDSNLRTAGLKVISSHSRTGSGKWLIVIYGTSIAKVKQALGGYKMLFNTSGRGR